MTSFNLSGKIENKKLDLKLDLEGIQNMGCSEDCDALSLGLSVEFKRGLSAPVPSTLLQDLVEHFALDSNGIVSLGSTGNITLLPLNGTGITTTQGKIGNCADFANNNNMLFLPASGLGIFAGDVTVAFWLMLEDLPSEAQYFQLQEVVEIFGPVMMLRMFGTPRKFEFMTNAKHIKSSEVVIDTWYFVVMKKDSSGNISFKVNDVAQSPIVENGVGQGNNADIAIGGMRGIGSYNCKIDEFSIWRRLTTDEEDTLLYNSGNALTYPFS